MNNTHSIRIISGAVLLLSFILLKQAPCSAAYFSEQLRDRLQSASSDELVPVLVFLKDQLDVSRVEARHKLATFSRQARHQILVRELQSHAAVSQEGLVAYLEEGIGSGEVAYYESYWIANALQVTAIRDFIESLQNRDDIEAVVEAVPPQSLYHPGNGPGTPAGSSESGGASPNLRVVGADEMWALGYTGEGRLIACFDTGVDGNHPALRDSYRGNNGHTAKESWFDPVFKEDYPHYEYSVGLSARHGTWTMGILVGKDDETGDTTGVAWGAQWIAAMVVDVVGANYLQAFQWVADPDGDPSTIDDVPDVLSNSWGFWQSNLGCREVYWSAIDNIEALGTVVVFGCGNEGDQGAFTLRNPANRATTDFNTFSVGAIDSWDAAYTIWEKSSRGPSDCDSVSIKPEVVAPGDSLPTTDVNGGYLEASGTSFATPHVAGAVALLRQYNPNASVETVKAALMNSAVDLGDPGDDNTYGMGLINIPAALALMPPSVTANIFIKSVFHDSIVAGDTFSVNITLKNSGLGTSGVVGQIIDSDSDIVVIDGHTTFGNINTGDTASGASPYRLYFGPSIPNGVLLDIDLEITADGDYSKIVKVYFLVGEPLVKSTFNHVSDSCKFTVSNYGTYGLAAGSMINDNGLGFRYPASGINNLFHCGLLIGRDSSRVSDGVLNSMGFVDDDFSILLGGNLRQVSPGCLGDVETFSSFCDSNAFHPLGVTVEQRTASCLTGECANYVVMEYAITNHSSEALESLYVGLYTDWDFPVGSGAYDRTGLAPAENLGYMWNHFTDDHRGTAVLNHEGVAGYSSVDNDEYVYYTGLSEAEKYFFLTGGASDAGGPDPIDQSIFVSTGPFSLEPGMSDTAAFAVIGAANLDRLKEAALKATSDYRAATPIAENAELSLPSLYSLEQNYPNPFNPDTRIGYRVGRPGRVTIEVFNLLGQRVITLLDQYQAAGSYVVRWDGRGERGDFLASGIYLYRMRTEDFSDVKKMVLMK